jgi:hypothetical protein
LYFEVFDEYPKRELSHRALQKISEKFSPNNADLMDKSVDKWINCLMKTSGLFSALNNTTGYFSENLVKEFRALIGLFKDQKVWDRQWTKIEAISIMGQIIELVNKNDLNAQSKSPLMSQVHHYIDDEVKQRIDLISSRTHALLEIKNIESYLKNEFPLSKKMGSEKISAQEELDLIENHIENFPSQKIYRHNINSQDHNKSDCERELQDQVGILKKEIGNLRKKYSAAGTSSKMFKKIFVSNNTK